MLKSAVYQWIEKFNNSGSFKVKDNRTVEETELDCLAERINPITNGKRHFKSSGTDNWQKIEIINNNKEKYSVRKIRQIMIKNQLIFKYTKLKYHNHKSVINNDEISNVLNREFNNKQPNEVVVSDLTYVQFGAKWYYICLLIDLLNREIIGYSAGTNKKAQT
ncbi:hypothetical protein [Spiroplasma endosymbiont of Polydrusus cervinus]|uniref:hypothetical protein n=1 Tax=Spiroplasma endosymbiont of Polydrusus cervinus TaxID=3066287 RepID=UPI0030CE3768